MAEQTGIQLQRLRDFTVQIRHPDSGAVVGTGVVVSPEGMVVTCAHVAMQALGLHPRDALDRKLGVFLPQVPREQRDRRASIAAVFDRNDDDIVLLRIEGPLSLAPQNVAVIGAAEPSQGHPFQSYGYRPLDNFRAGWAEGTIQGTVDPPEDGDYLCEPVQLVSSQISGGMSGAPVLDKDRNLVIGLVTATWLPDDSGKDRDTAWAVDARVLSLAPLSLQVRAQALPLSPGRSARFEVTGAPALGMQPSWNGAPPPPAHWVGREDLLAALDIDWTGAAIHVVGLIGLGGEGKSVLARHWVEQLLADAAPPRPEGVFWWGFGARPVIDDFLDGLLEYLSAGKLDPKKIGSVSAKVQCAGAMLGRGRYVFVLDGVEVLQHADGERYGRFASPLLAELLEYMAAPDSLSFAVVTTRVQLHDLASYASYHECPVGRLSARDGVELLRAAGVTGTQAAMAKVVDQWSGHAFTLTTLGSFLAEEHGGKLARDVDVANAPGIERITERTAWLLEAYDRHLGDAERAFLMLAGLLRGPADWAVVVRPVIANWELPEPLAALRGLDEARLAALVEGLARRKLVQFDTATKAVSMHPVQRTYYTERCRVLGALDAAHKLLARAHLAVGGIDMNAWAARAKNVHEAGSLQELQPAIEAIYHACAADQMPFAYAIEHLWINRDLSTSWLSVRLGAAETALDVCRNFFPARDLARDPGDDMIGFLNSAAVQLENLGRLDEARAMFDRAGAAARRLDRKEMLRTSLSNQGYLLIQQGALQAADRVLEDAETLHTVPADGADAAPATNRSQVMARRAWCLALRGESDRAETLFQEATEVFHGAFEHLPCLIARAGLSHAEFLLRKNLLVKAAFVARVCLDSATYLKRLSDEAGARCLLGLVADRLPPVPPAPAADEFHRYRAFDARDQLDQAIALGRRAKQDDLIPALLARADWALRHGELALAGDDALEAAERAQSCGYRLRHVDATLIQARWQVATNDRDGALANTRAALSRSREMHYAWGVEDALALLAELEPGARPPEHGDQP